MSEWNPRIVRIECIVPHPNADRLEVAYVDGDYPVVVTKGDYQSGDLAAYIPIDTIVPDNQTFSFLIPPKQIQRIDPNGKCYHEVVGKKFEVGLVPVQFRTVKAKKIRGVYSQGLLIKLTRDELEIFPIQIQWKYHFYNEYVGYSGSRIFKEGDSITEFFGLTKWEEPEDDESRFHTGNTASIKAPFFRVPYYDIEGARKFTNALVPGETVILEEKIHGCNAAYTHDGEQLWVKSRNLFKPEDESCLWWGIAHRFNLKEKLASYPFLTFFGEIYGQVSGFPYDAKDLPTIRFFDIYNVKSQRFLDYGQRNEFLKDLELPVVPQLSFRIWDPNDWVMLKSHYGEGKSTLNSSHVREGFVIRPTKERETFGLGRTILKLVGESYNLSK